LLNFNSISMVPLLYFVSYCFLFLYNTVVCNASDNFDSAFAGMLNELQHNVLILTEFYHSALLHFLTLIKSVDVTTTHLKVDAALIRIFGSFLQLMIHKIFDNIHFCI